MLKKSHAFEVFFGTHDVGPLAYDAPKAGTGCTPLHEPAPATWFVLGSRLRTN